MRFAFNCVSYIQINLLFWFFGFLVLNQLSESLELTELEMQELHILDDNDNTLESSTNSSITRTPIPILDDVRFVRDDPTLFNTSRLARMKWEQEKRRKMQKKN